MKYLVEHTYMVTKDNNPIGKLYVTETPTLYLVSYKQIGYSMPGAVDWKYKKKEYKTIEKAIEAFCKEYYYNELVDCHIFRIKSVNL